ncbi:MAG: hypothetical protein ACT4PL_14745 [Phycisphaerales bacterium]
MATSQRTIEQVKSILGKLDRNIDALRERRLGDPAVPTPVLRPVPPAATPGFGPATNYNDMLIGRAAAQAAPLPTPAAMPAPAPKSPYGRAQPLRSPDHGQA